LLPFVVLFLAAVLVVMVLWSLFPQAFAGRPGSSGSPDPSGRDGFLESDAGGSRWPDRGWNGPDNAASAASAVAIDQALNDAGGGQEAHHMLGDAGAPAPTVDPSSSDATVFSLPDDSSSSSNDSGSSSGDSSSTSDSSSSDNNN
jgi:hypothetical protein